MTILGRNASEANIQVDMSLRRTSVSKVLCLLPVVVACSPPTDIAREAGAGGSATGGSNAAPTGSSSTQATSTTGGSSLAGTGGIPSTAGAQATSATGGSSLTGTGGTPSTGGSMSTGGHSGTANTQVCFGLPEAECNAKQGQCTSSYGYNTAGFSGTRTYVGCHTGWGCTDAETCAYPAGQPGGCMRFVNGCIPDGWVLDYSCSAPSCPSRYAGTGGATGTGGAASTGGSTALAGGATSTGGTASNGGSSSAGVHSRVIVVDPQTSRFAAYDAEGQLAHDYTALLDFPSGYDDRVVSVDTMAYSWDGTASSPFFTTTVLAPPGQDPPLASTEIIVRAKAVGATKPMVTVRVANISGQVTDEFSVLGDWQGFLSSPSRQYLQGGISGTTGLILRRSDHGSVWQGPLFQAGFSPDDKHLIVIPTSSVDALLAVELGTGRVTNFDLSSLPQGFRLPTDLYVRGTFNSGAVLTGSRSGGSGYTLYWAGWDGKIAPFDPTLPVELNEWAVAANRDATRMAFWRNSQSSTTASWFEFDVSALSIRALPLLNNTSGDCYDSSVGSYYTLSGGTVSRCSCATASCASFASWTPPTEYGWASDVVVSPRRSMVGVEYYWFSQMINTSIANSNLYSDEGTLLTFANGAMFAFDRFDELALVSAYVPKYSKAVFSRASGRTTPLGNPARLAIGYE